ncbi:MAG: BRO domain-containing protein [Pseudomonas sp.]|nr:BRO domain-containing protein [Pseudomonas sp.]
MTSLTTRNFIGLDTTFPVRIVELNGQPWFVGSDVLKVLYGRSAGLANIYTRLADDEVTKVNRINLGEAPGRQMALVSESGLYKLVMRSDKPQARLFQDWVTRDVLPAIRKDGAYVMGEEKVASGEMRLLSLR